MTAKRIIRGEQQPGFLQILSNWLPHQPWCPALPSRRSLSRVGGLRLPAPTGDSDPELFLELHIFEIDDPDYEGDEPILISVPLALRSRPSTLAGKAAFIGKLTVAEDSELWVYDGARDRAFLAAIIEMARRRQGSRNGRSRGDALGGFEQWQPFTADLKRNPIEPTIEDSTRIHVQPAGTQDAGDWGQKVVVDFLRRPSVARGFRLDTLFTLTAAHSRAISRVLGTVTGAWQETLPRGAQDEFAWDAGELAIIREAGSAAPAALDLARTALRSGESFGDDAHALGLTLGNFHADLAGTFGAHPQTAGQLKESSAEVRRSLQNQWKSVRAEFDEDEAADLQEVIDLMTMQLRDADEPLKLQRIHGDLTAAQIHQMTDDRWTVDEAGGFEEHQLGLSDVTKVLMSLANMVMEVASEPSEAESNGENQSADQAPQPQKPVNYGQWYEVAAKRFLEGYRSSDAATDGVDSVFFRAAMLTASLELFSRWEGRWVFRPSMLLQVES